MISRSARRRFTQDNTWPGFVDALSSLLLVIIFLLSVFALAQFFLGQALSGRDEALRQLEDQVSELGNLLRLERQANADLRLNVGQLSASLQTATMDRDELEIRVSDLTSELADASARLLAADARANQTEAQLRDAEARYSETATDLEEQEQLTAAARAEVQRLSNSIAALRQQLGRLEAALQASEAKDVESQAVIADLGRRLNVALAAKVEELAAYRSEFYGRLREVLSAREDIRVEGDRFVFQSELLFASGSADLGLEGQVELAKFARTLLDIADTIPPELKWILRVDGHTDRVPISSNRFPSNWELSTARAISVVRFLISEGVPPDRLAAAGFGEYQPLDAGNDATANRANRRIEMRLTQK